LVLKQNMLSKFQQINVTLYEGQYESKAYFILRNYNHNDNYNEIYVCHGYILHKVEIIFSPSLLHYQHLSTFA